MADLIGRIREHLHFETPEDQPAEVQRQNFWNRHNKLDNDISSLFLSLPSRLKLPTAIRDPAAVSVNLNVHSLVISLHRAMIMKLEQSNSDLNLISHSQQRCQLAADEIVNILRLISHLDLSKVSCFGARSRQFTDTVEQMSPFTGFALSVAASVFIPNVKRYGQDTESYTSLQFVRSAMHSLKTTHPITGSFLVQLDIAMGSMDSPHGTASTIESEEGISRSIEPGMTSIESEMHPQLERTTFMEHDLKRYNALPISLEGILPERMQKQNVPSNRSSPGEPNELLQPELMTQLGFDLGLLDRDISSWETDQSALADDTITCGHLSVDYNGEFVDDGSNINDRDVQSFLYPSH